MMSSRHMLGVESVALPSYVHAWQALPRKPVHTAASGIGRGCASCSRDWGEWARHDPGAENAPEDGLEGRCGLCPAGSKPKPGLEVAAGREMPDLQASVQGERKAPTGRPHALGSCTPAVAAPAYPVSELLYSSW